MKTISKLSIFAILAILSVIPLQAVDLPTDYEFLTKLYSDKKNQVVLQVTPDGETIAFRGRMTEVSLSPEAAAFVSEMLLKSRSIKKQADSGEVSLPVEYAIPDSYSKIEFAESNGQFGVRLGSGGISTIFLSTSEALALGKSLRDIKEVSRQVSTKLEEAFPY